MSPAARLPLGLLLSVGAVAGIDAADSTVSLVQTAASLRSKHDLTAGGQRDLAMAYLPYNFGHTVAMVAKRDKVQWGDCGERFAGPGSKCLGNRKSKATGCDLMYTPGKYWPKDAAEAYFGNRTVFGILRDPYERMVAQFRGSGRIKAPPLFAKCDVNAYVKQQMQAYIKSGKPFESNCNLLPQAEFFDQPFGATIAVDNRRFPYSVNELMKEHGYGGQIKLEEVSHVSGCDHVWAGDLDAEAKALVRQVYGRDFELLCKHFGYCDKEESICLTQIQGMCPEQLFKWDNAQKVYVKA